MLYTNLLKFYPAEANGVGVMKNRSPIPIAIAGCGFAARQIHAPRLLSSPELFKVVAVCDPIPQAAQTVSAMFGGVPVFAQVEPMLREIKLQALAVLSTHHAEPVRVGLEHNLDIFVEKPFCETVEDGHDLVRMTQEKKRVVMVGAMRVFDPALDYVRSLLAKIAPLRWVEVRDFIGQGLSAGSSSGGMVATRFQAGLPLSDGRPRNILQTLLLMFIHDISILRGLFGAPIICDDTKIARMAGRLLGD
jgi:predicted dehydrogenase